MTLSVTVDASGISAPSLDEILSALQNSYRAIYGADIYLEADSQDGQFLAVLASAIKDCNDGDIAVYNNFSPATALGAGLSSVIKVNGIARQIATNSTAVINVVGQAGTVITNGLVTDNLNLGTRWALESPITIPGGGAVAVTATSLDLGNVTASPNTLTNIINPQPGWQTATNPSAAAPGAPVETDAALRRRQARSAALPADSTLNGIYAAVANVVGVTRAAVYQNDTNVTDPVTFVPAHNIAVAFEGGSAGTVASAVALKKPPGIPTFGGTPVTVFDSRGVPEIINLQPISEIAVFTLVFVSPLTGYVSTTDTYVQQALGAYFSGLDVFEASYLARAYGAASLMGDAAVAGTGFTQTDLDALSRTYHVTEIAQAREDMRVTSPFPAGTTVITFPSTTNYATGRKIYVDLDDLSHHAAIVTNVAGAAVTFTPAIPVGRGVLDNALVYVVGDITPNEFYVALYADPGNATVITPP